MRIDQLLRRPIPRGMPKNITASGKVLRSSGVIISTGKDGVHHRGVSSQIAKMILNDRARNKKGRWFSGRGKVSYV